MEGRGSDFFIIFSFFSFLFFWPGHKSSSIGRVISYDARGSVFDLVFWNLGVVAHRGNPALRIGRQGKQSSKSSPAVYFDVFLIMVFNHIFSHFFPVDREHIATCFYSHLKAVTFTLTFDSWRILFYFTLFYYFIFLYFKCIDKDNIKTNVFFFYYIT